MLRQSTFILCGMTLVFTLAAVASATMYTITDLGTLGGTTSYAMGVNDSGVVVGSAKTGSGSATLRAAIYTGGAWVNIGGAVDSSGETFATGINDAGQVALWNRTNLPNDSYVYNISTSTYTDVGAQPGVCNGAGFNHVASDSWQNGNYEMPGPINSSGQLCGVYTANTGNGAGAFIWNGSSTVALVTPGTGNGSVYACGINDAGVVVGAYQAGANPIPTGFYYSAGTLTTINGGNSPESVEGNYVTGNIYVSGGGDAFLYTLGAPSATDIGTLASGEAACGYAVNASGTVVGQSFNNVGTDESFIYNVGGTMTNLGTLISGPNPFSDLEIAQGISSNGNYIVGFGIVASTGQTHGYLLTAVPTPEPSTLLLAAAGLAGLLAYAWRKRK